MTGVIKKRAAHDVRISLVEILSSFIFPKTSLRHRSSAFRICRQFSRIKKPIDQNSAKK